MLIELKDVAKRFGEGSLVASALIDVQLMVDEGEFVVVLGPSGSGKIPCSTWSGRSTPPPQAPFE